MTTSTRPNPGTFLHLNMCLGTVINGKNHSLRHVNDARFDSVGNVVAQLAVSKRGNVVQTSRCCLGGNARN